MRIEFPLSNVRSLPSAAAPGAFFVRCLFFLRVILQQLSVAVQLPFRGDVSLSTRCKAARIFLAASGSQHSAFTTTLAGGHDSSREAFLCASVGLENGVAEMRGCRVKRGAT